MSYGSVSVSVDIDIDDVLWELSRSEKQELVNDLYDDGYTPKQLKGTIGEDETNNEFDSALRKLYGNSWRLTKEQEQYIIDLAKQFN